MDLTFLGGAGTVTGSKYVIEAGGRRILIDCGLFQGLKRLRLKNWAPFPIAPRAIDAVILTHAHIDHSGYLPLLIRNGFRGPIYSTAATRDLCALLLPDSGHLQEEEAERANRLHYSKHRPALPLYTRHDAEKSLRFFETVSFDEWTSLKAADFQLSRAGHLLGSAVISFRHEGRTVVFSGDLGRPNDPMFKSPAQIEQADYVVIESTYGDREHIDEDPRAQLADVVNRTVARGGVVIVPAFAVGRTQSLLYHLHTLLQARAIPRIPIFIDSPMAASATRILLEHCDEHRLTRPQVEAIGALPTITQSVGESKAIDQRTGPMIVISASGMATGGSSTFSPRAFCSRQTQHHSVYRLSGCGDAWRGDDQRKGDNPDAW